MSKNYTVQVGGEYAGYTIPGLTKNEAIAEARQASKTSGQNVFVSFFRSSDGQTVYLNSDGSHDITGKSWS